ncbi:MAG: glycerate kinase type-2 family protein [Candidatus Heimdallarchaeaceae archaeon]|jgi:glycerate-2-kinase
MYIKNRDSLISLSRNEVEYEIISLLSELIEESLDIAQPCNLMAEHISFNNTEMTIKEEKVDLSEYNKYHLLALGKASQTMSKWLLDKFPSYFSRIILVSPNECDEHFESLPDFSFFKAGHPKPNSGSLEAAEYSLKFFRNLSSDDLCFVLISGGGSSLFESPDFNVSLEDYQSLISLLLSSGASIHEINTIRKHFSKVKGGKLALETKARIITVIISDVIGNDPSIIASGPTTPDKSTWNDCEDILKKYNLQTQLPKKFTHLIDKGLNRDIEDTPSNLSLFSHVSNFVIGDNYFLSSKLENKISNNHCAKILTHTLSGESSERGKELAITSIKHFTDKGVSCKSPYCFLLFSGETTVTLTVPAGLGGRNQELALSFALEIADKYPIYLASFGTDGIDGTSLAAGALVGPFTISDDVKRQKAITSLSIHDSNSFFKENGGEIITDHTGTNLMDIGIICLIFDRE